MNNLLTKLQTNLKSQTARKGYIVVIDQCVVSGVTFLTGIILARFLKPAEYGVFVLAYAILLFMNTIQASLVTNPIMVISAPLTGAKLRSYITSTGIFQLFLGALIALLILGASVFQPVSICLALAFAVFAFQAQEFFRRTLFSRMKSADGLINDILSYGLQITGILVLLGLNLVSVRNAFYVIGIAASTAAVLGVIQCRGYFTKDISAFKETIARNWGHGRWLLSSNLTYWVSNQSYLFITAFFLGPVGPAILKACQNIIAPTHIVLQSLENIIPSTASRKFAEGGMFALRKLLGKTAKAILLVMVPYCLIAAIFGEHLLNLLYKNQYQGYGIIVILFAILYIISSLNRTSVIGLRVLDKPQKIFFAYVYASILTILISIPLVKFFAVTGAVISGILSASVVFTTAKHHFVKATLVKETN